MNSANSIHSGVIGDEVLCLVNVALNSRSIYLGMKGLCEKIDFSQSAIKSWVKDKTFPQPVTIKDKPRWVESEVDTWIEQQNPTRLGVRKAANKLDQDAADIISQL